MKQRCIRPEILDQLPVHDPDAIRSRRDLRWINLFMSNHRWLARQIAERVPAGATVLELGAGDGTLLRHLMKRGIVQPHQWHALDLLPKPLDWPAEAYWWQQDVFAAPLPEVQVIIANLFLHHFQPEALQRLSEAVPKTTQWLFFNEPERRIYHVWQGWLLHFLIRLNRVTRHDMRVSIEAGFRDSELVSALGITHQPEWQWQQSRTVFGAHRVAAQRLSGS